MKYAILILATIAILAGCMDPTLPDNRWGWNVEASGEWTLSIDAEYSDGWKTHIITERGNQAFDLGPILGTEQKRWSASFSEAVRVRVVYDGGVVHDGKLTAGEQIRWRK